MPKSRQFKITKTVLQPYKTKQIINTKNTNTKPAVKIDEEIREL